jgi:hypothetical protein
MKTFNLDSTAELLNLQSLAQSVGEKFKCVVKNGIFIITASITFCELFNY